MSHNPAVIKDLGAKLFWNNSLWQRRIEAVADEAKNRAPKFFEDYTDEAGSALKTPVAISIYKDKGLVRDKTDFPVSVPLAQNVDDKALFAMLSAYAFLEDKVTGDDAGYEKLLSAAASLVYASATLVACGKKSANSVEAFDIQREIKSIVTTLAAKSSDYGQSWRRHGLNGLCVRLYDKIARYINLVSVPATDVKNEPVADTAKDMLGYSVITFAFILEQRELAGH